MNVVHLLGRLGQDPEIRSTQGGTQVGRLSIATTERVKNKDGTWGTTAEWHKVTLWGRDAENAGRFLHKGDQVAITGRLKTTKYQDKQGQDRYTTEIVCERMEFVGTGKGGGQSQRDPEPRQEPPTPGEPIPFDEDLPF